jgi:hypothetical protein
MLEYMVFTSQLKRGPPAVPDHQSKCIDFGSNLYSEHSVQSSVTQSLKRPLEHVIHGAKEQEERKSQLPAGLLITFSLLILLIESKIVQVKPSFQQGCNTHTKQ